MQAFLMHVGYPGNVDIPFTVTQRRTISELLEKLPPDAEERPYFERNQQLRAAFPGGCFHCWGVPSGAEPAFRRTEIGDLVLFAPHIGIHDGGIYQIGVVKALCPDRAYHASAIL